MLKRISVSDARPVRTARAFRDWLTSAFPGEVSIYHRGLLAADGEAGAHGRPSLAALISLAGTARRASDEGLVHLVQLRLSPGPFAYLAVRRSHEVSSTHTAAAGHANTKNACVARSGQARAEAERRVP